MANLQSWRQMASFQAGGAICLPVLMVGYALCRTYGVRSALIGVALGNLLLYLLALASANMSFARRMTTAENSTQSFGRYGVLCFAAVLLLAKLAWFALQLNMMASGVQALLPAWAPANLINLGLGYAIVLLATKGVEILSLFAAYSMPLLVGTLGYLLYAQQGTLTHTPFLLSYEGISVVIAAAISRVVDMPTFYRNSRSLKDCLITVTILFMIALPLIEGVGIYLAAHQQSATLIEGLAADSTIAWKVWIAFFLIAAGWTTNNTNLYSATACMETFIPWYSEKARTLIAGSLGVFLSCFGLLDHFTTVLQLLGITIGTIGCVVLCRYLLKSAPCSETQVFLNLLAWGIGMAAGIGSMSKYVTLTTIPLLDACLTACVATCVMHVLKTKHELAMENTP
jgi:purine-cytosine permease-like protein